MQISDLITTIENEISLLQEARKLLAGTIGTHKGSRRRKRMLSAEGRERIAAAQRKRWAQHRKAVKR